MANAILFSYMSIPAYAASGLVMRKVTTDLVKGAFVDEISAEDELMEDEIDLIAPESPNLMAEIIDEYSVVDEPIDTEESLVIEKADNSADIPIAT